MWAVALPLPEIERTKITVCSDDKTSNKSSADRLDRRLMHWRLVLSGVKLDVVHQTGKIHQAAEAPLRLQTNGKNTTLVEGNVLVFCITNWPLWREEARVLNLHNNIDKDNYNIYEKNSGLPRVFTIAATTGRISTSVGKPTKFCFRSIELLVLSRSVFYS